MSLELKPASAKWLLMALAFRADEQGRCFPSIGCLSRDTSLDRKTIVEHLRRLQDAGLIRDTGERVGKTGRVIVYQLIVPKTGLYGDRKNTETGTIRSRKQYRFSSNNTDFGQANRPENGIQNKSDMNNKDEEKELRRSQALEVLQFLNAKAGRVYPPVDSNIRLIEARLAEGFAPVQMRQVVVRKVREWSSDPKMSRYLRPKTLFGKENFANYVGELVEPGKCGEGG